MIGRVGVAETGAGGGGADVATRSRSAKKAYAVLPLQRISGEPVMISDLIETQTKKIHLPIVDTSLSGQPKEQWVRENARPKFGDLGSLIIDINVRDSVRR